MRFFFTEALFSFSFQRKPRIPTKSMEEIQVSKNGKFQIPTYYNCKTFSENGDENVFAMYFPATKNSRFKLDNGC